MERHRRVTWGYGWLNWVVRVQSVTGVGVLISPSAPVSSTGTGFDSPPSRGPLRNLPSFPRRRAVHRDENDKVATPFG